MNEIEAKRNELQLLGDKYPNGYNTGKIEGFNLGVEMAEKNYINVKDLDIAEKKGYEKARKEFLDLYEKLEFHIARLLPRDTYEICSNILSKYKQSLGEKTE